MCCHVLPCVRAYLAMSEAVGILQMSHAFAGRRGVTTAALGLLPHHHVTAVWGLLPRQHLLSTRLHTVHTAKQATAKVTPDGAGWHKPDPNNVIIEAVGNQAVCAVEVIVRCNTGSNVAEAQWELYKSGGKGAGGGGGSRFIRATQSTIPQNNNKEVPGQLCS
jgi:hypothetical protein